MNLIARDGICNDGQGTIRVAARLAELLDDQHQHVQLTDRAEPDRNFAEPPAELRCQLAVELEDRQKLAEPACGDARPVDGANVPFFHARQQPDKSSQTLAEELVA